MKNVADWYRLMLDLTNNTLAIVAMCARYENSQSFSYFDLWLGDNTGVSNLVERSFPVPCNFRCSFQFPHISYFQSLISLLHTSYYFYWNFSYYFYESHSYFLLMSSNFLSDSAKTYRASFRWFSNSSEEKSNLWLLQKPTDVLFVGGDVELKLVPLGDLLVSPEASTEQAAHLRKIHISVLFLKDKYQKNDFVFDLSCKPVLSHISLVL